MRAWHGIILVLTVGAAGLIFDSHPVQVVALALAVALAFGLIYRIGFAGGLRGERVLGDRVLPWGSVLSETITLLNPSWHSALVRISDGATLPKHPRGYVTSLPARRALPSEILVPCTARGRWLVGPVTAAMSDPLGLFPIEQELASAETVLVLPRWVPLARTALGLEGQLAGSARARRRGESPPSVASVREYVAGDALASIHWPATARAGRLMTKLYDGTEPPVVWLILDLEGHLAPGVEETLVTAAASLAMYALTGPTVRVGLVACGRGRLEVGAEVGRAQQYKLLERLADARAGTDAPLLPLLARLDRALGAGHIAIVLTSRRPPEWATWIGRQQRRAATVRVVSCGPNDGETDEGWGVPALHLARVLADPARESALIAALEGDVAGHAGVETWAGSRDHAAASLLL